MTVPNNIGPEDLANHAEDIALLKSTLNKAAAVAVDFLTGHSAIVCPDDQAALGENARLMLMIDYLRRTLTAKLGQSEVACNRSVAVEGV